MKLLRRTWKRRPGRMGVMLRHALLVLLVQLHQKLRFELRGLRLVETLRDSVDYRKFRRDIRARRHRRRSETSVLRFHRSFDPFVVVTTLVVLDRCRATRRLGCGVHEVGQDLGEMVYALGLQRFPTVVSEPTL